MTFDGWPEEALEFYEGLTADNSKAYWTAHKAVYEDAVLRPMTELVEELAAEFGEAKIFRPYRDVRFSADKSPYKTHIGAVIGTGYVQLSADGPGHRGRDVRHVTHPARPLPPGGAQRPVRPRAGAGDRRDRGAGHRASPAATRSRRPRAATRPIIRGSGCCRYKGSSPGSSGRSSPGWRPPRPATGWPVSCAPPGR